MIIYYLTLYFYVFLKYLSVRVISQIKILTIHLFFYKYYIEIYSNNLAESTSYEIS